jgi:hypothetical protein
MDRTTTFLSMPNSDEANDSLLPGLPGTGFTGCGFLCQQGDFTRGEQLLIHASSSADSKNAALQNLDKCKDAMASAPDTARADPRLPTASTSRTNDNGSPGNGTSCALAMAPPEQQGSTTIPGAANMRCGGRSPGEINAVVLAQCPNCSVVVNFTHACGAYSQTAGNNRNNTATGWATSQFADASQSMTAMHLASDKANQKCAAQGGIQCSVRFNVCDVGGYIQTQTSTRSAH